jgi:hypothetical protein
VGPKRDEGAAAEVEEAIDGAAPPKLEVAGEEEAEPEEAPNNEASEPGAALVVVAPSVSDEE